MAKVTVKYGTVTKEYNAATTLDTAGKLMTSNLVLTPEQGSGEGDIQPTAKYVQPGTASKTVTPDTGYDGLSQVDVAAVTNNLSSMAADVKSGTTLKVGVGAIGTYSADDDAIASVQGTMPVRSANDVTGTQGYDPEDKVVTIHATVPEGYYPSGTVADIDFDLGDLIPDFPAGVDEASDEHIQLGYKAYDDEGNVLVGTMPNLGNVTRELQAGQSYTIPQGKFTDVSSVISAASLASQTSGNATAADILETKTAWVNGTGITGTMPNNGATGSTITSQGGTYTIPAGYTSGGTVTANLPTATKQASTTLSSAATGTATSISTYLDNKYLVITPSANVNQNGYATTEATNGTPVIIEVFQLS